MADDETMVRVRMKNALLAVIDAAAERMGKSRSDFIRDASRAAAQAGAFFVPISATDGKDAQPADKSEVTE